MNNDYNDELGRGNARRGRRRMERNTGQEGRYEGNSYGAPGQNSGEYGEAGRFGQREPGRGGMSGGRRPEGEPYGSPRQEAGRGAYSQRESTGRMGTNPAGGAARRAVPPGSEAVSAGNGMTRRGMSAAGNEIPGRGAFAPENGMQGRGASAARNGVSGRGVAGNGDGIQSCGASAGRNGTAGRMIDLPGSGNTGRRSGGPGSAAARRTAAASNLGSEGRRTPGGARSQTASRSAAKAKKNKTKKRVAILAVAECLTLAMIFLYAHVVRVFATIPRPSFEKSQVENPNLPMEKKEHMKGFRTIAVFGVDSRGSNVSEGTNADVNMICNINMDTGEIKLVSIFRDTYLNVNDKNEYNKLNAAYAQGGPEQALKVLNKNLDLNITDYVTFNWKAVADGINILGGVEDVEISKAEFYYINSFITETVKATGIASQHLKKAGVHDLDGVQAVSYGRLRLMDTDYARTERQRLIISKAFDKAKVANYSVLNNILEVVFKQISTNLTFQDMTEMALAISKYHIGETGGFPFARGDTKMGKRGDCVIPQTLESNVVQLHKFLFDKESYEPTDMVKKISAKIAADSNMYSEGKYIDRVPTDGGYVPKATKAPETEKSAEESEESESTSEGETKETKEGETTGDGRPGGEEVWPTDENGNPIDPALGGSGNNSNSNRPTAPGETKPAGTKPSRPDGTKPTGPTGPEGPESPGNEPGPGTQSTTAAPEPTEQSPGPGSGPGPGETGPGIQSTTAAENAPTVAPPPINPGENLQSGPGETTAEGPGV